MFVELIFHWGKVGAPKQRPFADGCNKAAARERMIGTARQKLLLPGALLVTIQAQLFTTFVFIDLGLAAFFD